MIELPDSITPVFSIDGTGVGVVERTGLPNGHVASWISYSVFRTGVQAHRNEYDASRWLFWQYVSTGSVDGHLEVDRQLRVSLGY